MVRKSHETTHGEEEEGQLNVAGEEGGEEVHTEVGVCSGESSEKTDVKPDSFLKED